ncbi:MAG: nuclear transport factor 2 family protein [Planctomycetota bacterium]
MTEAERTVRAMYAAYASRWTGFAAPVTDYVSTEDRVVALGRYEGTHAETGREMVSLFAHAYVVRAGRVVRFDQIADTWPMVAADRDLDA